ncbi:MAG: Ig-like domain-containing protein [Chloroflexi bacterium]|nr:Ig-like domain-containing protein [Chloroflexota bacterium]
MSGPGLPGRTGPCYGARGHPPQRRPADSLETVSRPQRTEQETVVLRKVATAALAVPVLALLYLPLLARRSVAARIGLVASVGVIVLAAAFGLSRPVPTTATAPSQPITALADDAFRSIGAATDLRAPVDITFSETMDPTSVARSLSINPANTVELVWNPAGTILTIRPTSHWAAGTYHSFSVAPGALAANGRPMSSAVRAAFVTRPVTTGRIVATKTVGDATSLGAAFRITFDRPVATNALAAALRISPNVAGTVVAEPEPGAPDPAATEALSFAFRPAAALTSGTTYRLAADALADTDGAAVSVEPIEIATIGAPSVIRFRPVDGTKRIERGSPISVRFSEAMTHATTRAAFSLTAAGKPVSGTFAFTEKSAVLVFKPAKALPAGATIVVRIEPTATSIHGVPLGRAVQATLTTAPAAKVAAPVKAAPKTTPKTAPKPTTTTPKPSGGGAVGGGSWGAVESYYLRLMNCTRTGGWVTSTGSCSSPGGRSVAPLKLDAGISSKVSRPYAKKLAVNNLCTHFSGGNPGDRLRRAGYTSYIWAENLGCRSGNPSSAVLGSHLYFQNEKSYLGGHYVNLMNAKYDRVGIGVWVSGGRVRLVVDFYHPR